MQDENLGLVYQARVRLKKSTLMIDGVKVNLSSGMQSQFWTPMIQDC